MTGALEALRAEEERRDRFASDVRAAVLAVYAVGGDTSTIVRRSEVQQVVADALELPVLSPQLRAEINEIVQGLGARPTLLGGQKFFTSMRRHDVALADARRASTDLRRRYCRAKPKRAGARGAHGAKGLEPGRLAAEWEARLAAEGMPAELALIPRTRRSTRREAINADRDAGKPFEESHARFEAPALVTTGAGVHRQPSAIRADFVAAEQDEVAGLLEQVEEERQVLRLRAEGLSLRKIGVRMGIDKMEVSRVLERIRARRAP